MYLKNWFETQKGNKSGPAISTILNGWKRDWELAEVLSILLSLPDWFLLRDVRDQWTLEDERCTDVHYNVVGGTRHHFYSNIIQKLANKVGNMKDTQNVPTVNIGSEALEILEELLVLQK